jgi:hypothetical protein
MATITPLQTHSSHTTTAALTMTLAFTNDVVAGSVIIVLAGAKKSGGSAAIDPVCTDSQGNTYTILFNDTNNLQRWRTVASSSGPLSITVDEDSGAGNQFYAMGIAEIPSGSYTYDVSAYVFTSTSTPTSNNFTVTEDGAALFGFLMTGALGPPVSITENGAWTLIGESVNDSYVPYSFIWRNADIGTHTASWTLGASPFVYMHGVLVEGVPDPTTIEGSSVFGVTTTVTATRAVAFGLDGETNTLSEAGKVKVFGNLVVTGDVTFTGDVTVSEPSALMDSIVTTGSEIVYDSSGNVVVVDG